MLGESKKIVVESITLNKDISPVNGNQFDLPNVIANFISNAIKYNNNGLINSFVGAY
jgi:hypothetical protein